MIDMVFFPCFLYKNSKKYMEKMIFIKILLKNGTKCIKIKEYF